MIGTTVGAFRITDMLGDGGLGPVYRAVDPAAGQSAAVRVFTPEVSRDAALVDRLQRLMPILQRLQHPNLAAVYGLATVGGSTAMISEYVPGATLDHMRRRSGTLAVNVATSCAVQVLRGLEHLHGVGVFHHAVRPTNLMATQSGTVKLVDVGIGHAFGANRRTRDDRLLAVMAYLAPEQIRNQAGDARSDLYALGVVLFELLAGRLPFAHQTEFALMQGHLNEPPVAPGSLVPGIPTWVDQAVLRALAKRPEQRFGSAAEMRAALESGLGLSTSGSTAVVRGASGAETVAMFTEAPPIPDVSTMGMGTEPLAPVVEQPGAAAGAAVAPPVAPAPVKRLADEETLVLPLPTSHVSVPVETPPPDTPGAAVSLPDAPVGDQTVVLTPGAGPARTTVGMAPVPGVDPPRPAAPQASSASGTVAVTAPQLAVPAASLPLASAARALPPKAAAAGTKAAPGGGARSASRLAPALVAVLAMLGAGLAGVWWVTRAPADSGEAPASAAVGAADAAVPSPLEADSTPVSSEPDAAGPSQPEMPLPVSTVPPPETEPAAVPAPPPPVKSRPKAPPSRPAPPKPVVATADPGATERSPSFGGSRLSEPPPLPPADAPASGARLTPIVRPALPDLSFQKVKLVTEQDGKAREIDVQLMFLADRLAMAPARGGAIFRSVAYRTVGGGGYTRAEKRRLFIKSAQHMFTIDAADGPLLLRLDKENVEAILQAFEVRTGKSVVREE